MENNEEELDFSCYSCGEALAMNNCLCCHTCGHEISFVLDGEEWCDTCQSYQRPDSHNWASGDRSPCPNMTYSGQFISIKRAATGKFHVFINREFRFSAKTLIDGLQMAQATIDLDDVEFAY